MSSLDKVKELEIKNLKSDLEFYSRDKEKCNDLTIQLSNLIKQKQSTVQEPSSQDQDQDQVNNHYLLFHDSMNRVYGNIDLNDNVEEILSQTVDSGVIYYDFYNRIINKNILNGLQEQLDALSSTIIEYLQKILSDDDYKNFIELHESIYMYYFKSKKTKISKYNYNSNVNKLYTISLKCGIDLCKILSLLFNKDIILLFGTENINDDSYIELHDYINEYSRLFRKFEQEKKFITNIDRISRANYLQYINKPKINIIKQEGKYFKKWSLLKRDEKFERITSHLEYTYPTIQSDVLQRFTVELLLIIKYQDLKWNTKSGIVESIKIVKYNQDDNNLTIHSTENKTRILFDDNNVLSGINEEILYYILTIPSHCSLSCIKYIGEKLKISKIHKDDKAKISEIYKKMSDIITQYIEA